MSFSIVKTNLGPNFDFQWVGCLFKCVIDRYAKIQCFDPFFDKLRKRFYPKLEACITLSKYCTPSSATKELRKFCRLGRCSATNLVLSHEITYNIKIWTLTIILKGITTKVAKKSSLQTKEILKSLKIPRRKSRILVQIVCNSLQSTTLFRTDEFFEYFPNKESNNKYRSSQVSGAFWSISNPKLNKLIIQCTLNHDKGK